jgi:hypothetical protein
MIDYSRIVPENNLKSIPAVMKFFVDFVADVWIDLYIDRAGYSDDITLQYYYKYAYIFDDTSTALQNGYHEYSQPRVLGAFGISHGEVDKKNRKIMRRHPNASVAGTKLSGLAYDNGHFMSHLSGGSIDLNLFPQRRDVNRGWSEWRRYRDMERFVCNNPGTFAFSRPIYDDLTIVPSQLEYGYYDLDLNVHFETFPNR